MYGRVLLRKAELLGRTLPQKSRLRQDSAGTVAESLLYQGF
jgi:hypothetical protein